MNNSTDNKNNTKAAKIAVLKKYAIPLVAILPLQFVIMSFGIRNDMQFIFFIFSLKPMTRQCEKSAKSP